MNIDADQTNADWIQTLVKRKKLRRLRDRIIAINGGQGSGNFDHAGRPGKIGGSQPNKGHSSTPESTRTSADELGLREAIAKGLETVSVYKEDNGEYTKERQQLHNAILNDIVNYNGEGEHRYKVTKVDNPVSYVMGGGSGAGKSTLLKQGLVNISDNHSLINADEVKEMIPEYNALVSQKIMGAAGLVHEESSDLANRALKTAIAQGHNTLLDGTGDSGLKKLSDKIDAMREGGRKVIAHYCTIPTEMAIERARKRAERSGRDVLDAVIRDNHKSVSAIFPDIIKNKLYDEVTLWNTEGKTPVKIMEQRDGITHIHRQDLYDAFLKKGNE